MKAKIPTLIRSWSSNLLFCHDTLGPEVEVDDGDVNVEACGTHRDEDLTVYLYSRSGKPTLTVRYLDLKSIFPGLAAEADKSREAKRRAPDPCAGSAS